MRASAWVGSALLLAGACLLHPKVRAAFAGEGRALRIAVVDASQSAVGPRSHWASWVRSRLAAEASGAARESQAFAVLVFGADVRRVFGPGRAEEFLAQLDTSTSPPLDLQAIDVGRQASELAHAVSVAGEIALEFHADRGELVLLADGSYTGVDPRPAIARSSSLGLRPRWIALADRDRAEYGVGPLRVSRAIEEGAPLSVGCELFSAPGARAPSDVGASGSARELDLEVRVTHASHVETRRVAVHAPDDALVDAHGVVHWWHVEDLGPARAGITEIALSLGASDGDGRANPEARDRAWSRAIVRSVGSLLVGVVAESSAESAPWIERIASGEHGLELLPLELHDVGRRMRDFDLIVTLDLDPRELSLPELSTFVESGGAWLAWLGTRAILGTDALRARGVSIPLPLTPVEPDATPRDVILLIDGSGSMAGEPYARLRAPLAELIEFLAPSDSIEMFIFAGELGRGVSLYDGRRGAMSADERRAAVERLYSARAPGGPTALLSSLEELARLRAPTDRESLIVLMSDGREDGAVDVDRRTAQVLAALGRARARLLVVAAGRDADLALLAKLAPASGVIELASFADAAGRANLRDQFVRETEKDRVHAGDALRVLPAAEQRPGTPSTFLPDELRRVLDPTQEDAWPKLARYVRAKSAEGSDVLWIAESGEPLFALQRVGRGWAGAFAFAPNAAWVETWNGEGEVLRPCLRALARRDDRLRASVGGAGSSMPTAWIADGLLVVDQLDRGSPVVLDGRVMARAPRADEVELARARLAPAVHAGENLERREAPAPSLRGVSSTDEVTLELTSRGAPRYRVAVPIDLTHELEASWPRKCVAESVEDREIRGPLDERRQPAPDLALGLVGASLALLAWAAARGFFVSGRA